MIFKLFIRIYVGCLDFIIKYLLIQLNIHVELLIFNNVSYNNFIRFDQVFENIIRYCVQVRI